MGPTAKTIFLGCGIGCLVVVALVVVAVVGLSGMFGTPRNIELTVDAPVSVASGQEFVIRIEIANTEDERRELDSIDVADEYLAGIAIRRTEPPFSDSMHVPIDNTRSFTFHRRIPAKGSLTVELHATAVKEGDYSGDLDVCIDAPASYVTHQLRTVVGPAAARGGDDAEAPRMPSSPAAP